MAKKKIWKYKLIVCIGFVGARHRGEVEFDYEPSDAELCEALEDFRKSCDNSWYELDEIEEIEDEEED